MFGTQIKQLREMRGLTQTELAEKLGVSRQALCMWEANKRGVKASILNKIARTFNVSIDELIGTVKSLAPMSSEVFGKKNVSFTFSAPTAQRVSLVGDFNDWDPKATLLRKNINGVWSAGVTMPVGRYEYKFLVDAEWYPDPNNNNVVLNRFGTCNSVITVGK